MLNICLILLLILSIVTVFGLFLQKDLFCKILFLNTGTSIISLFICFLGSFKANSSYIDIALIYFLLSVIASSAYLKYLMRRDKIEQEKKDVSIYE